MSYSTAMELSVGIPLLALQLYVLWKYILASYV